MRGKLVALLALAAVGVATIGAGNASGGGDADKCEFDLVSQAGQDGTARVSIRSYERQGRPASDLRIKIRDAENGATTTVGDGMYTVWVSFKGAPDLPATSPTDTVRDVAPAFSTLAGVTAGLGLDDNAIVTNSKGKANFRSKLDYDLLLEGDSPVVGALALQASDPKQHLGGGWMRIYQGDGTQEPDFDRDSKGRIAKVERATAQGIIIVFHRDMISHGHTPGVKPEERVGAWKADFPSSCMS